MRELLQITFGLLKLRKPLGPRIYVATTEQEKVSGAPRMGARRKASREALTSG